MEENTVCTQESDVNSETTPFINPAINPIITSIKKTAKKVLVGSLVSASVISIGVLSFKHYHVWDRIQETPQYSKLLEVLEKPKAINDIRNKDKEEDKSNSFEILGLSNYIQLRNSKIPVEIATLEAQLIIEYSKEEHLPSSLVVGMIEKESLFNPLATSDFNSGNDHAKGLMQIYKGEGFDIDDTQIYDLKYNIKMGCKILNKKLQLTRNNLERALNNYSGNSKGYSDEVLVAVGRYTMYHYRLNNPVVPEEKLTMN